MPQFYIITLNSLQLNNDLLNSNVKRVSVTPHTTNFIQWLRFLSKLAFSRLILQMYALISKHQPLPAFQTWLLHEIQILLVKK